MTSLVVSTALLLITASAKSEDYEAPRLKSLTTIEQQCARYMLLSNETLQDYIANNFPNEPEVQQLVHCFLLNMNAWDEETGIKDYVVRNYFKPDMTDTCYESRTQECLREELHNLDRCEVFRRAYHSYKCYYQNFGKIVPEVQFIPYYQVDREKFLREAFAIEGINRAQLEEFKSGNVLSAKDFPILYYIDVVRTGFYDTLTGHDVDRLYTQFGNPELVTNETRQCLNNVSQQFCDEPTRAFQGFNQCLRKSMTTEQLYQKVAEQVLNSGTSCC